MTGLDSTFTHWSLVVILHTRVVLFGDKHDGNVAKTSLVSEVDENCETG